MHVAPRFPYWLLGGLLLAVLPLFFLDVRGRLLGPVPPELYAFGHVGLFALVALALMQTPMLRRQPYRLRATLTLLAVLLVGGVIELLQPLAGRSAGLLDLWQNLLGGFAAVALLAPSIRGRAVLGCAAAALLAITLYLPTIGLWDRAVAYQQFPLLSDFEARFDHRRWNAGTPDPTVARSGQRSLRLDLEPGRYSGTLRRRSLGNWDGYADLELSIYLPEPPALVMTISVRDHEHFRRGGAYQDRFNRPFRLEPGWNDIVIPIEDIRTAPRDRNMELNNLSELVIFTTRLEKPRTLYLDRVRLAN